MAQAARRIPTEPDAFIVWENRQPQRHELIAGLVRMMSGGTLVHDLVAMNIAGALGSRLRGTPCRVHGSNLKIRCPSGSVLYADTFVPNLPGSPRTRDGCVLPEKSRTYLSDVSGIFAGN